MTAPSEQNLLKGPLRLSFWFDELKSLPVLPIQKKIATMKHDHETRP
jgi:hypothetical protein